MGLLPTQLLHNSQKLMSLVSARQEALADNIANMHTIGYKRKDVDFSQYLNSGTASSLERKLIDEFGSSPITSSNVSSDNISVEDELSLMQENYLYYSVASRQLSSTITQIRTALNMQGG